MTREDACRERTEAAGQDHIFRFSDQLDEAGRERLFSQAEALDFGLIAQLGKQLESRGAAAAQPAFAPPELFPLERDEFREQEALAASGAGESALREGLVGYVLVAGGQGSRLGFEGPKGKFPVGPVSGCSLFEWHARRLVHARETYGSQIAWYIMTSGTNDAETQDFFREHDHFGLGSENVMFFQQAMLPALDANGRILMTAKDELFLAPNGHGGTLAALSTSGCLADAEQRGIEVLSYFQVDNPLARPADPLFLGLHVVEGASMSSKVVTKRDANEKVGVLGLADGVLGCIEYSDLSDEQRCATDADGQLQFRAGNIAVHALERRFVSELTEGGLKLPWHIAQKNLSALDESGNSVSMEGFKFETFVFDALGQSPRSV
ncbi:MAG: UTP--glucose-1-phosphate uridylyltransferase, partial [Candidatus Poseidoniia archaeon]